MCSEERQSLSHVTYSEQNTFSGDTAGLKMETLTIHLQQQQQQSSVSELIMCLTVNTAVEERDQTHRDHTSVLLLH